MVKKYIFSIYLNGKVFVMTLHYIKCMLLKDISSTDHNNIIIKLLTNLTN